MSLAVVVGVRWLVAIGIFYSRLGLALVVCTNPPLSGDWTHHYALIDMGSQVNIISGKLSMQLNLPIGTGSPLKLHIASWAVINVVGVWTIMRSLMA